MPLKSPFFERTSKLCISNRWKEWAGYHAVSSYETLHDIEYVSFRHSAGLLDITPLYKYLIQGPDAAAFLSRIMVKDITKLGIGRVTYCCWCTDQGKVIDDGTVMRRSETDFFVTSADPNFSWFSRFLRGYNVKIEDASYKIAGLALQGPTSRDILKQLCSLDLDKMKFFSVAETTIGKNNVSISRTGYTGDLGYELWMSNEQAIFVWDLIMNAGNEYNIRPAGLDALDMVRVEAGLILKDVDYFNALHTLTENRMSTPNEISLGWTVNLDRESFNGQHALKAEKENGSDWAIMGVEIDWLEIELLFASFGLPPEISNHSWRASIPIYDDKSRNNQIGYATSGTWSPVLKKNIALATLQKKYAAIGKKVQIEFTVEHIRHTVTATICSNQFFNPERKTSIIIEESKQNASI